LIAAAIIVWGLGGDGAAAQESVTLRADLIFYGDNTEFSNPFREGETIFGTALRAAADIGVSERVRLSLGVFTNQRFGGDDAFELVRPIATLEIRSRRSSFVFGTLPGPEPGVPPGPDRTGPHRLLPPLQRETLAFDRPYEAGLQWRFAGARFQHDAWLNWQRLNTPLHRERFDAGLSGRLSAGRSVAVPFQLHIVHEGGQLFASGPVADSIGAAAGIDAGGPAGPFDDARVELYGLAAADTPDRGDPAADRDGAGFFGRASARARGWRGHLLFWRGRDFVKREGDPNYQSVRRDGSGYRGTRDYAEAGLTRTFTPASRVLLEASARVHRVEKDYGYSYRVLATVGVDWRLR
jgi:hypothetical protein